MGLTQQEFAVRLGLSLGSIARYETNSKPSARVLRTFVQIAEESSYPDLAAVFSSSGKMTSGRAGSESVEAMAFSYLLSDLGRRLYEGKIPVEQAKCAVVALLDRDPRRRKKITRIVNEALRANPKMFPDPKKLEAIVIKIKGLSGPSVHDLPQLLQDLLRLLPPEQKQ